MYVFSMWQLFATTTKKLVIAYYGASGHGKGLVDAMSGFGVKGPLKRAVILKNFSYRSAEHIHGFLYTHFKHDDQKHSYLVDVEDIAA